jgi:copper transport protein
MLQEPLLEWSEPFFHYLEFASVFLPVGAVGFRYTALRGGVVPGSVGEQVHADAARRAAWLGLFGTALGAFLLARALPALAARRHTTVTALVTGSLQPALQVILLALAIAGFLLVLARGRNGATAARFGWMLAALGVVLTQLRGALGGQLLRLVNPLHVLFASLWIGTLFVLVVAGIGAVLQDEPARERRGSIVADMVNRFSPLAVASAGLVALFGVITAWRHLHRLSALWTTPYGYALLAKLVVVGVVMTLGAWNWRRQRPRLGSEDAARAIRRSATAELIAAGVVLLITGVLVSLPSPPREPAGGPAGPPPTSRPPAEAPR